MTTQFDITPYLAQDEGQHFERKSLFQGEEGKKRVRDRREVRDQVAMVVASFANAEGGVLVLGIEDDGVVTGHQLPASALHTLLATPRSRLHPPQAEGFTVEAQGKQLIVFDVVSSDVAVQVVADGFPLRIGDQTVQASESQINALKLRGLAESWESFPSRLTLEDLDRTQLARARRGAGYAQLSDEEYLLRRRLADRRGARLVLRRAAELLFSTLGPEHPNAGLRIFRVLGTERRFGVEHNVEERPRVEGNLAEVLEHTLSVIRGLIRHPSRLRGTRFQQVPEYPEFCWVEAVLNAIAHRDYAIEGNTIEIWFFDDRLEVKSPGGLLPNLSLDELLSGQRVHVSRNPRLVRALVDLGAMRDQGEGIPRMFAEMAGVFLPAPDISTSSREFTVTLRNTPSLTAEDRAFIARLGSTELQDHEFRALLEANRHERVDNARMRQIAGLDTLSASSILRRLRDQGLLELHAAGAASYYTLPAALLGVEQEITPTDRGELPPDRGEFQADTQSDWEEFQPDRGEFEPDRGELQSDRGELPPAIMQAVEQLGKRPRKAQLRAVISTLCSLRWFTPADLGELVGIRSDKLVERHLTPMVEEGRLERKFPDILNHPTQAYRTTQSRIPFGSTATEETRRGPDSPEETSNEQEPEENP